MALGLLGENFCLSIRWPCRCPVVPQRENHKEFDFGRRSRWPAGNVEPPARRPAESNDNNNLLMMLMVLMIFTTLTSIVTTIINTIATTSRATRRSANYIKKFSEHSDLFHANVRLVTATISASLFRSAPLDAPPLSVGGVRYTSVFSAREPLRKSTVARLVAASLAPTAAPGCNPSSANQVSLVNDVSFLLKLVA